MKVITVINDTKNVGFGLFRTSCALNELELVALVAADKIFSTNKIKDDMLVNYLQSDVDAGEVILFTDGNDALMLANEEEIMQKYRASGIKLLFSAETGCWPDESLADQYPQALASPYRYLNSGGFIGEAGLILECLETRQQNPEKFSKSNQYTWTKVFFDNQDKIGLDSACSIFYTFSAEIGAEYLNNENDSGMQYYNFMKD